MDIGVTYDFIRRLNTPYLFAISFVLLIGLLEILRLSAVTCSPVLLMHILTIMIHNHRSY